MGLYDKLGQYSTNELPLMPTDLSVASRAFTTIDLEWTNNSVVADFPTAVNIIQRWTTEWETISGELALSATTFQVTGLTVETEYRFRAAVKDSEVLYSTYGELYSTSPPYPVPENLTVSNETYTGMTLTWDNNSVLWTAVMPQIYTGGTWNTLATLASGATSYDYTNMTGGTAYDLRVVVTILGGDYPSAVEVGTTTTYPVPENVTVSNETWTGLTLTWDNNSVDWTAVMPQIYTGGTWNTVTTLASGATTYDYVGLTDATQYPLRVGVTIQGTDFYSASVTGTTATYEVPENLAVSGETETELTLNWDNNDPTWSAVMPQIYSGSTWFTGATLASGATSYEFTGLTNSTYYPLRVEVTIQGDSYYSATITGETVTPAYPTNGLVSRWTFDDDTLTDVWGGEVVEAVITGTGHLYYGAGHVEGGRCIRLRNAYLGGDQGQIAIIQSGTTGLNSVFTGTSTWSVAYWAWFDGGGAEGRMAMLSNVDSGFTLNNTDGKTGMAQYWQNYGWSGDRSGGTTQHNELIVPNQNEWYHCMIIFNVTDTKYYINNTLVLTVIGDDSIPLGTYFVLYGQESASGSEVWYQYDNSYIYNREINELERNALWNDGAGV